MTEHRLVDTHCHLGHIDAPPERVVEEAAANGVDVIVDIGMGVEGSRASAAHAETLAPVVYATVGLHPNDLEGYSRARERSLAALEELAEHPRVVGIGETGLDHYRDRSAPELQEEAFRAQIELARRTGLALVVHCRDAHHRLLELLLDAGPPERVVMHCFSGDLRFAEVCAEHGFFCSFAGNLTYKRNDELRTIAASLPADLVLIETDAPFLAPEGHRGKPNSPALLPVTAAVLAEARSIGPGELAGLVRRNAERAFGIRTGVR